MKLIATCFFLFITFFSPNVPTNICENDDVKIKWSESQKLTWADFRGTRTKGEDYVASTSSGISFSYSFRLIDDEVDYKYTVICHFYPQESWYDVSYASNYILKHEQTHFDISELHARILRKKLAETNFSKYIKQEIEVIYQDIENRRVAMQHRFDSETQHSKIKENEYQWEAFIAKQLESYEHWK